MKEGTSTPRRRLLTAAVRIAVGVGVLAVLAWRVDLAAVRDQLAGVAPWSLGAALVAYAAGVALHAWRWRTLLRSRGLDPPVGTLARLILGANFLNLVLPGNLGGDLYRAYGARDQAASLLQSAGIVVFERYCGFLATFLMALVALASGDFVRRQPELTVAVLALFVAFLLPLPLAASRGAGAVAERLLRRMRLVRLAETTGRAAAAARTLVRAPRLVAAVLALSAGMKLCVGATLVLLAAGLGLHLDLLDVLIFLPLHTVVSALPLTVNGLGLREANLVGFFSRLGLGPEQATTLAFLHLIWLYATALPGAVFLLAGRGRGRGSARGSGVG